MILGMSVGAFTILHVIIALVAIGSGLIVVGFRLIEEAECQRRLSRHPCSFGDLQYSDPHGGWWRLYRVWWPSLQ